MGSTASHPLRAVIGTSGLRRRGLPHSRRQARPRDAGALLGIQVNNGSLRRIAYAYAKAYEAGAA